MKKQRLTKLHLEKTRVSDLTKRNLQGGEITHCCVTGPNCPTFQETLCFTFCIPGQDCLEPC